MIFATIFVILAIMLAWGLSGLLGWAFYVLINDFEIFKISAKANHLEWKDKYKKLEKDYAILEQKYNDLKKEMGVL